MHMLYGAPQDPRNFFWNRTRYLLWLLLIAPLIVVSYVPSTFITAFLDPLIEVPHRVFCVIEEVHGNLRTLEKPLRSTPPALFLQDTGSEITTGSNLF